MADSEEGNQAPFPPNPSYDQKRQDSSNGNAEEDDDYEDDDDEDEEEDDLEEPNMREPQSRESFLREQRFKINHLARRMSSEEVPIRVHDVLIKGNTKTKDWVIEAELQDIQNAKTMQELLKAAEIALMRLQRLGIFDSSNITLEAGPPELGDIANVIVQVSESNSQISGGCGVYMKPSVRSYSLVFLWVVTLNRVCDFEFAVYGFLEIGFVITIMIFFYI